MEDKSKCTKEVWDKAQDFELQAWMRAGRNGDDWNQWWAQRFDNYSVLTPFVDKVQSMIEVGCGPYAKNSQILFGLLRPKEVVVADPLLSKYQENGFEVSSWIEKVGAKGINKPLEELQNGSFDVVICINVLDHVIDSNRCMNALSALLSKGGLLIIGQDLTSEEDLENQEVRLDVGHPIKLDHSFFEDKLKDYECLFEKILKREEGRNPKAHYGTLLYIGKK